MVGASADRLNTGQQPAALVEDEKTKIELRRVVVIDSDVRWVELFDDNIQRYFSRANVNSLLTDRYTSSVEEILQFLNAVLSQGELPDMILLPFMGIFDDAENRVQVQKWAEDNNIPLKKIFFLSAAAVEEVVDEGFSYIQKHGFSWREFKSKILSGYC